MLVHRSRARLSADAQLLCRLCYVHVLNVIVVGISYSCRLKVKLLLLAVSSVFCVLFFVFSLLARQQEGSLIPPLISGAKIVMLF